MEVLTVVLADLVEVGADMIPMILVEGLELAVKEIMEVASYPIQMALEVVAVQADLAVMPIVLIQETEGLVYPLQ